MCEFFMSDVISGGLLGHHGRPASPGPEPKPLDGSISLKFLLESRLQSEFFRYFGLSVGVSGSNLMI